MIGPKETANSFKYRGWFCFAENRGMLPSIELLNELDVIVIVINRRLLEKRSVFIVVFPFLWWNKTDKCIDL